MLSQRNLQFLFPHLLSCHVVSCLHRFTYPAFWLHMGHHRGLWNQLSPLTQTLTGLEDTEESLIDN